MFVTGFLFESKPVTCVRFAEIHLVDKKSQSYLEQCFLVSFHRGIDFYNQNFEKLAHIDVDETLVQFDILVGTQRKAPKYPQIALITYNHKLLFKSNQRIFIYDLELINQDDMQTEEDLQFKVHLQMQHQYDFEKEVQMSQNYNITIRNYYNYLLMDTQNYVIVFQEGYHVVQFPKQEGWSVHNLNYNLVLGYTKKCPEIVKGDSETRIKLIDSAKFDYVVLILCASLQSSLVVLYGVTKEDGIKQEPISVLNVGVSVESIYLISKEKPIYLCQSYIEECLKIFDLNTNTIVKKIDIGFDINNIFPFETGEGGMMTSNKENVKFSFDKDYNFNFVILNVPIELTGCAGNDNLMILSSHLDDSVVIRDGEVIHHFKNIGPISHLQEVRLNQRNIFINTLRPHNQIHRYRKGINVKGILATLQIDKHKQKPKKVFFIQDSLLLLSFDKCSRLFILQNDGLEPLRDHKFILDEQTILFVKVSDLEYLQVTQSAITLIQRNSLNFLDVKETIATGVRINYAYYCQMNQQLLLIDHQQFVYSINFRDNQHYIDTHALQIPGCINSMSLSQQFNILAVSILFQNDTLYLIDSQGQLHAQQIVKQANAVITSILFQGDGLNIAFNNGDIQQYTIDEISCELKYKNSIKVFNNSPITLIPYQNKFLCLSQQIQLVQGNKLVDINWDNVESVNSSDKLLIARMKEGKIQVVELDDEESQQCTSISNLQENVLFSNQTKQHYYNITDSHILVYDPTTHRQLYSFKHDLKVFQSKVFDNTLYLCGQNLIIGHKKQGCLLQVITEKSFQIEKKYSKSIIRDMLLCQKHMWLLQTSQVKCYASLQNRQRSIFSHDFQIKLNGFDVIEDYLLVYDQIKGVGLFKYDIPNKKLVAWSLHYKPVNCAHFLGKNEPPNLICLESNGSMSVVTTNQMALGIADKMQVLYQHSKNTPIYTTIVNRDRNQLLYGSLFGQLGFVIYLEIQEDYQALLEFQRIISEDFSLSNKNFHNDFIDFDIFNKVKNFSNSKLDYYLSKMVIPVKAQTIINLIERIESLII